MPPSPSHLGDPLRANARLIWWMIAAMLGFTIATFALARLTVDLRSNPALLIAFPACFGLIWFYRSVRQEEGLAVALETATQMVLILLLGVLLTYVAATPAFPYRDAEFYAVDQWLGLDRRTYLDFINSRPWLAEISGYVYLSIQPQIAVVAFVLIVSSALSQLQRLLVALAIALSITAFVSMFAPAVDAFVYLDLKPASYANISTAVYTHIPTLEALRNGTMHMIRLDNLEGLITFPSFHTTAAILFAWALWTIRYVRWPALVLNVAMIATTPIDGGHYFIDLLAGAVVAALAIAAAHRLSLKSTYAPPQTQNMEEQATASA